MRFLLTGGTLNPLKDEYQTALARFGHSGVVMYPGEPMPDINAFDALLLPGGGDIHPSRFGKMLLNNKSETPDIPRDELEFAVLDAFLQAAKPVFGICRGMQVINVALGGTIWQDLPSQCGVTHAAPGGEPPLTHWVTAENGERMTVNSYHHQAIKDPGRGLLITARSEDGVAEALRGETGQIRAVQWHPEKQMFGLGWLLGNR
jgi:putative glutamine amidotransferase